MGPEEYFCPTCKKPALPGSRNFPFCSERCRMVDLGQWLTGGYRISRPHGPKDTPIKLPEDAEAAEDHGDG